MIQKIGKEHLVPEAPVLNRPEIWMSGQFRFFHAHPPPEFGGARPGRGPLDSRASRVAAYEPKLALVPEWGGAHMFPKMLGERTLIAVTEFARHLTDLGALPTKGFAGGLNPNLHQHCLGAGAKRLDELPVQLSR